MSVFTEIILSFGLVTFILWLLHHINRNKQFYNNIPGVPTVPILGNALDFGSTKALLKTLVKYTEEYGEIVKIQIGPLRKMIVVSDYKFLECILSSTKLLTKSDDYRFMQPWLGTGLLTTDGAKWKTHRRVLTPAFHFQILEQFIDVFESCGEIFVQKLKKQVGKYSVDIYPLVTLCTLDIICESTMGVPVNAQIDENSEYVRSVKDMCRILMDRSISPVQMYDFLFPLTKNYYTQNKALNILHTHTNNVITKRRNKRIMETKDQAKKDDFASKERKVFLDILLDATIDGRPLTHEEIREEVDTFMFEGHDTTGSAVSFTLFCLANHPEVQATAFEEQQQIFDNNKNPKVTYADLQKMKYLEQVIKESLRLYPSVPMYGRRTTADVEYENTSLPEGDTVIVFAYGIHRNPKYFENPNEFNPSRFESIDGSLPYAYIPFSAGPRNCIGQKFAMLEMKSTISKVLRTFVLEPATPEHKLELISETILKSSNGINISLKLR
jgi:cytochrome P450 family 4